MRVSFLGIGAQKAATSWLHDILADHPQVVVPAAKEVDFFSYRYENGLRWYERHFPPREGARQYGEISPSYLHEPGVAERVCQYNPAMQVVVSLRDPVERALSQHRHLVRLGVIDAEDRRFETALATNPTYVEQGRYHHHLSRWFDTFGRERVHVVLMEDIERGRADVARGLYRFLGVSEDHWPASLDSRSNPSYAVRSLAVERSVQALRNSLTAVGAGRAWRAVGDLGLRDLYRRGNRRPSAQVIPPVPAEVVRELRGLFRKDTERLAHLIQRDLSGWMAE